MKSRILGVIGALALTLSISSAGASLQETLEPNATASKQQVVFTHYCEATNGFGAAGFGYAWNYPSACHIAKSECANRAAIGTVCNAVRWYRV